MAAEQQQNNHPSETELLEFLNGNDQEYSEILKHVERCPTCEKKLANIADQQVKLPGDLAEAWQQWLKTSLKNSLNVTPTFRFEILNEISTGGMGVIVRAKDRVLKRIVALKIIKPQMENDAEAVSRFIQEARISALLQHPGIVPVHDLGVLDGRPFLAMKLVDGETLSTLIKQHTPVSRLLEIFAQVCQTMAYVHSNQVVHRDLKPQNIMVGEFGEVQVMDWGLSKVLGGSEFEACNLFERGQNTVKFSADDTDKVVSKFAAEISGDSDPITKLGVVIGTPSYMSPEQANGEAEKVGPQSDVYALGAVLCTILTGCPPCGVLPRHKVVEYAQNPDYTQLDRRLKQSGHDPVLLQLVRDCLAKSIEDRLPDANAVHEAMAKWRADNLQRLQQIEIDLARTEARATIEKKRRRLATGLALAVTALLITIAASLIYLGNQKSKEMQAQIDLQHQIQANNNKIKLYLNSAIEQRDLTLQNRPNEPSHWQQVVHEIELARQLVNADTDAELSKLVDRIENEATRQLSLARQAESISQRFELTSRQLTAAHQAFADRLPVADSQGRRGVAMFETAFATFGIPVDCPPQTARQKYLDAPEALKEKLVIALLEWHLAFRQNNEPGSAYGRWLQKIFENLDHNPNRCQVRRAYLDDQPDQALALLQGREDVTEVEFLLVSESLLRNERDEQRREILRRAVTAYPDSFWLNARLAVNYTNVAPRLYNKAINHFFVAAAIEPECISVRRHIGGILIKQNKYDDALEHFQRLVERNPNVASYQVGLGAMLNVKGQLDDSLEHLHKAAQLDPTMFQAFVNIGEVYSKQRQPEKAKDAYQTAIRLAPDSPEAYISMAKIHYSRKEYDEGLAVLDTLLERKPDVHLAQSLRAGILVGQNKFAEASEAMRRVVELVPEDIGQYVNLCITLKKQQRFEEAIDVLQSAEKIDPTDFRIFDQLEKVYKLMGQSDNAQDAAQRLAELKQLNQMGRTKR